MIHSTTQQGKTPPQHDDSCGLDLGTAFGPTCPACIEERRRAFAMLAAGKSLDEIARAFRAPIGDVQEWLEKPQGIVPIDCVAVMRAALTRATGRRPSTPEPAVKRSEIEQIVRDVLVTDLPGALAFLMSQGMR